MAFWDIDLTTRAGAREAARTAATGAYLYAGASLLSALIFGAIVQTTGGGARTGLNLLPILQIVLALFAGFRLQDGKGMVIGSIFAVVVALNMLAALITLTLGGLVLGGIVLVLLVQGLRGVHALNKGTGFEDDASSVFE